MDSLCPFLLRLSDNREINLANASGDCRTVLHCAKDLTSCRIHKIDRNNIDRVENCIGRNEHLRIEVQQVRSDGRPKREGVLAIEGDPRRSRLERYL